MNLFGKNKEAKSEKKVKPAKKVKAEKKVKKINKPVGGKGKSVKIGTKVSIMAILMMLIVSTCNTTAVRFYIDLVEEQLLENGRQGMLTLKDYLASSGAEATAVSKMIASDAEVHRYIADKDTASIRRTVNTLVSSDKISYMIVVGNDGKVIYNSAADNTGEDYSGISLIKAALVGSSNTTYLRDFQSQLVQASAVPVKDTAGKIIGAIIACTDLVDGKLIDTLNESHGHQYTVFVDDTRAATTIVDDAGNKVVGTKATEDVIEIVMNQQEDVILQNELFGHKYASVYSPIVDNNNKVVGMLYSGVSTDEAISKANKLRATTSIITTVATILFAGLFLVYVKKTITAPIQKVTEAANRISNGEIGLSEETNLDLDIRQKDEIGDLANALEATSGMLKAYIGEMSDVLGKIAKGDLTAKPELDYKGDLVSIKDSLMLISKEINNSMSDIMISSEEVSSGASQVSDGAQSLSQGATEQASEIDSLSELVKDITSQISNNASNATEASNLVSDSTAIVVEGQNTMNSLAEAMSKINEMTAKMEKVVKTIDNFAFQTNILALNATVEAARAGSHGKGFAIVAEEVRSLANKSATAANETGELIEETVEIVESGVALANATTEEFAKVVDLVEEVNTKVEQIADASNAQAAAASKIVVSVDEISRVIQTNSATAEESAAASEELSGLAQTLANVVAKFKLDKKGAESSSTRAFTEGSITGGENEPNYEIERPAFNRANTYISNDAAADDKYF